MFFFLLFFRSRSDSGLVNLDLFSCPDLSGSFPCELLDSLLPGRSSQRLLPASSPFLGIPSLAGISPAPAALVVGGLADAKKNTGLVVLVGLAGAKIFSGMPGFSPAWSVKIATYGSLPWFAAS